MKAELKKDAGKSEKSVAYARRFKQILDYIDRHLDEELTVDKLALVANLSRFHFHRQFSLYCGISISRYIQLARLKRASYRLVFNPLEPVIEIALEAGFENPESFSRAFKTAFAQTPSSFRRRPDWAQWGMIYKESAKERKFPVENKEVKVLEFDSTLVACLEHHGDPMKVNESACRFIEWRKTSGLSPFNSSRTFGVPYSDPDNTPRDEFRFDICGSVDKEVPENPQGVITKEIPGGRCAVLRHLGSHDAIADSVYFLYRNWLPESGEELRDFPCYFHYLNSAFNTPEAELITDVYLPLK